MERIGARPLTWQRPDFPLLAAVAVLLVVGLDMVYSASYVIAHNDPSYGNDAYFLLQQLWRAGLGLAFLLVAQATDYHLWRRIALPFVALAVLLLVAVLATHLAHTAYGAQRWLKLGPLPAIEPSELVKLALVVYFADWLSRRQGRLTEFASSTVPFAVTLGGICVLVILQPDLGTAIVIAATSVCLFFVAGADLRQLAVGLIGAAGALVLVVLGAGYRSQRIAAFLDPSRDPLGVGWNITQAQIALGSGGVLGLGLGASRQKFYYLPNAHTDAIFAVVGEELGLLGTLGVLFLFGFLAFRGFRIARRAPDSYGALLATGITCGLVIQALINIGVITATIPFTGIPLPFVSYGGSSLVVSLLAIGIMLNVSRQGTPT
ncbi:MAG TPA: putative lipid II flippase FtsW [Chloroflexota bacterium]